MIFQEFTLELKISFHFFGLEQGRDSVNLAVNSDYLCFLGDLAADVLTQVLPTGLQHANIKTKHKIRI
jgi:hypothetical protein